MSQHELKNLEVKLSEATAKLANAQAKKKDIEREINLYKEKRNELEKQIKKLKDRPGLVVTEHAILRYFERVLGYDLEALKKEILGGYEPTEVSLGGVEVHIPVKGKVPYKLRVVDNTVTTLIV